MDAGPVDVDPRDLDPTDTELGADPTDTERLEVEPGDGESVDVVAAEAGPNAPSQHAASPYGSRREARERALSLLYEADAKDITPSALLEEIPVEPPPYVTSLVAGVGECHDQIDDLIGRYAIDWTVDRMPVIDRTVVRMATFELLRRPDVPTGVVISEAVELAKRYSTEESGRFVNGILASIAAEIRPTAD